MAIDTVTNQRARRALTHGAGIDGVLFAILAGAGIVLAILILIAGLQSAESRAEQAVDMPRNEANAIRQAEIGTN